MNPQGQRKRRGNISNRILEGKNERNEQRQEQKKNPNPN